MAHRVIQPDEFEWTTRDHEPDEPARHVAELSETAGFAHTRANVWRYDPGAKGRRHKHKLQEETFVVLSGTLSMYLGDPPERQDVPPGGLVHVEPGTALQTANHGDEDLVLYVYGTPAESEHAELLDSAL
jgi:quercetin dioxygenase-like cupin family protein